MVREVRPTVEPYPAEMSVEVEVPPRVMEKARQRGEAAPHEASVEECLLDYLLVEFVDS